jgi:hypothetical protein
VVQLLYKHVVPKPKAECNKTEQLAGAFLEPLFRIVLFQLVVSGDPQLSSER